MTLIRATYRLQLNKDFPFAAAASLAPYLSELGISHVYLSPILMARPGSTHGYDTVDHARINPELGTLDDFRDLVKTLKLHDLGVILDFVPNHMGVGGADNAIWLDVLRHGKSSPYADWLDVDWAPPRADLRDKLLVPFLGTSLAEALTAGDIRLKAEDDELAIWAYDETKLPIRPEDEANLLQHYGAADAAMAALNGNADEPTSWAALEALIASQHWRLSHFATAADDINYRRFFINSDLAGIRIDRPDVFDHAHKLIFALVEEGLVDGLRIDHVDGLLDPKNYLETLRAKCPRPIYLIVEKILAPHEQLRPDWPVDGTTGYEFGAMLTRVLTNPAAEASLSQTYSAFAGQRPDAATEQYDCKLRVMDNELAAELTSLSRRLADIASSSLETSDHTQNGLRKAVREVIAHLDVYRTYADDAGIEARDRRELQIALEKARRSAPHYPPALFDFVGRLLLGELGHQYDPKAVAAAVGRFQQYTGPVMAKGLEDTALYRDNGLVSLNEVGAHPDRFSVGIAAFHDANLRRRAEHPRCMLATSTHDTKRGEDTRAIIGAIADHADHWAGAVAHWRSVLEPLGAEEIHANDLYLFFQLLLGGWPLRGEADGFADRIKGAMTKSLREARERSDWGVVNAGYEAKVSHFIDAALEDAAFMARFLADRAPIVATGRRKGLIQAGLKLTVPGMPDIYRGAEHWEQSFVDPDNRRPLDFAELAQLLAHPSAAADEKLKLTQALLQLRRRNAALFIEGDYQPLDMAPDILAFRRSLADSQLLVMANLSPGHIGAMPTPPQASIGNWTNVITNRPFEAGSDAPILILASGV